MIRTTNILLVVAIVGLFASPSNAHMVFKKELEKKYPGMKVSCNACHVKGKPKSERSDFGKLFYAEFKSKELTKNFKAKQKESKAAKTKYEKETMIPAFKKAIEKIAKQKEKKDSKEEQKNAKTYDELIKAGEIANITKKPKKD